MKMWLTAAMAIIIIGLPGAEVKSVPDKTPPQAGKTASKGIFIHTDKIVYRTEEPIVFTMESSSAAQIRCKVRGDGGVFLDQTLPVTDGKAQITVVMKQPGWLLIEAAEILSDSSVVKDAKGKMDRLSCYGVLVSPLAILPGTEKPQDFEAFWKGEIAKLRTIPMNPKFQERKGLKNATDYRSYDVTLSMGEDELPIYALLVIPRNAAKRSLGIHLALPGAYFGKLPMPSGVPGHILLFLNIHGIPNTKPDAWYAKMRNKLGYDLAWINNVESRDTLYYKRVILRMVRSMDFLKSLPEWDGVHFRAEGASQGGGLAVIAAALEPSVTECHTWVTALCDHGGILKNRQSGWPQYLAKIKDPMKRSKAVAASRYLDAAHFASMVKCPIIFRIGLTDTTCSASSIFAAYNRIPAGTEKSILVDPRTGHTQSGKYVLVHTQK